jgi:hypothetical protein
VSVEIGLRLSADADELHSIYRRIFGDTKAATRQATWSWQYERNPQSPSGPVVYVARHDAHALGQMGTMPVSLWWKEREVRASWGIDYFVSPDAEGQGHSIALAKAWMQGVDVALALGLAETSYLICRRLGFSDLGFVPFYQAILDPGAIAGKRYGKLAGRLAAPLTVAMRLSRTVAQASRNVAQVLRPVHQEPEIDVRDASDIGPDYDALWETARTGYDACVRRDASYVRWRYREPPHKQYQIIESRRRGSLTGFAVTRHEDYKGLRLGWIVDLFTAADDRESRDALLASVMQRFEDAGVARVQALCTSRGLAESLERHGFFAGEAKGHLCARANDIPFLAGTDAGRWHVVFGDGDWDR